MEHSSWLTNSLIFLAAAVAAVPISKALGIGSIIGYLAAGIAIGPWGLSLVSDVQSILHFAEFGVVLMLFWWAWSWSRAVCGSCAGQFLAGVRCRCSVALLYY